MTPMCKKVQFSRLVLALFSYTPAPSPGLSCSFVFTKVCITFFFLQTTNKPHFTVLVYEVCDFQKILPLQYCIELYERQMYTIAVKKWRPVLPWKSRAPLLNHKHSGGSAGGLPTTRSHVIRRCRSRHPNPLLILTCIDLCARKGKGQRSPLCVR